MDQRLSQRLVQKLALTPTLQQAIKLLQLSKVDLIEQIRQELDENPVLEESGVEGPPDEPALTEAPSPEPEVPEGAEPEIVSAPDSDLDWALYDRIGGSSEPLPEESEREGSWYENVLASGQSLQDYLSWQLHLTLDNPRDLAVGDELVGNIDDDGYLRATTAEIALQTEVDEPVVERVLEVVQDFDPPGVAARSLEECLVLQLRRLPPSPATTLAELLVREHLKRLENKSFIQIAQLLRRPLDDIHAAVGVVSGLEPRPGRLFAAAEPQQYVVPDLFIVKEGEGYRVVLNDEGLPRLRISGAYRQMLGERDLPEATREFIQKKFSSAVWLVKSIHQRQQTIRKVAESIIRHQGEFLDRGVAYLKPMVLRDVADDIGMHESTVSRVTNNKYAQTPQGLLELKYFFNTGISTGAGEAMASTSVQTLIQRLVGEEDPARPLSDQEIMVRLGADHGLVIARRTVAKYRGILRILPANKRRRAPAGAASPNPTAEENLRCI